MPVDRDEQDALQALFDRSAEALDPDRLGALTAGAAAAAEERPVQAAFDQTAVQLDDLATARLLGKARAMPRRPVRWLWAAGALAAGLGLWLAWPPAAERPMVRPAPEVVAAEREVAVAPVHVAPVHVAKTVTDPAAVIAFGPHGDQVQPAGSDETDPAPPQDLAEFEQAVNLDALHADALADDALAGFL